MTYWRTIPSADVSVKCSIYQGDALSALLFCIALNSLNSLLDKSVYRDCFKGSTTINHLLSIDNIKLYAQNEQDINSLIHLTRVLISTSP